MIKSRVETARKLNLRPTFHYMNINREIPLIRVTVRGWPPPGLSFVEAFLTILCLTSALYTTMKMTVPRAARVQPITDEEKKKETPKQEGSDQTQQAPPSQQIHLNPEHYRSGDASSKPGASEHYPNTGERLVEDLE